MTNKEIYKALRKALDDMHKEEEAETLAYFKRELLKHLNTLKDEKETHTERLEKAIFALSLIKSGYPVGTERTWRGTKFKKVAQGKWRRIYDSETRGAKMSIARLKKQVEKCESIDELFDIVMNNTHRFSDANGKPLAIVKELKAAVDEKKKALNADKPSTKEQIDDWKKQNKKKGVAARLRDEFTENTNKYLDHSFKNNATGIEAKFSKESQKELKSRTDNTKSNGFTLKEHFEVANQIKELFENATLENTHDDTKHGENNVKIERFLSKEITLKSGKKAQACITVKHSLDKDGRIIYSLEAMDIKNALEKTRAKGQPNNRTVHTSESITHTSDSVNGGIVKYRGYTIRDIKDGDKDFRNMDRENYVVVETPIGKVKLGERQFERLAGKDGGTRTKFMGALQQCLQRPDVIIGKTDNKNRYSKLYLKAFLDNNGKKSYLAVVPTIDGVDVVVSNSPRDTKDIAKEIKKAGLCYYIRPALTSSSKRGGSRMENSSVGLTSNNSRNEEVRPSNDSSIAENANSVNEELSLDEKMAKYKKQGKKIVKDERGLYFYEGMTTKEKIEWISQEIKNLSERNELLKKPTHPKPWSRDRLHTETMRYYSNGGDEKKLGAYLTRLEKQEQKLNAQLTKEEIKENESEIAQYKDDLVYYKSVL